uniref:Putative ovule protein n=1 Tax=Solanum chacoense TaxID=4108 RepID=A0A0V0H0M6_SOLCH
MKKGILRKQGGSPTTLKLNWINDALDVDPGYLNLKFELLVIPRRHQLVELLRSGLKFRCHMVIPQTGSLRCRNWYTIELVF